jgi:hypothetical protein
MLEIFTLTSLHCWYLYSINDGDISKSDGADDKEFSQPLLEQVKFDISNLTHEEYEIGKKLITDYNVVAHRHPSLFSGSTVCS